MSLLSPRTIVPEIAPHRHAAVRLLSIGLQPSDQTRPIVCNPCGSTVAQKRKAEPQLSTLNSSIRQVLRSLAREKLFSVWRMVHICIWILALACSDMM
jgi:hypothetical protein